MAPLNSNPHEKVVLKAETMRVRSVEMFHKELWMSLVAYNLISDFRREAAQQAGVASRRLSFQRVLTTFKTFLLTKLFSTAATCSTVNVPGVPGRGASDNTSRIASRRRCGSWHSHTHCDSHASRHRCRHAPTCCWLSFTSPAICWLSSP